MQCDFIFFAQSISQGARKILDSDWEGFVRKAAISAIKSKLDLGSKVLCVERPVIFFTTPFLHFLKFKRWVLQKDILRAIAENLYVHLPCLFLPDYLFLNRNFFTLINRKLLRHQLAGVLRKCGFKAERRVVWVYYPFQIESLGLLDEDLVIFECYDEYAASDELLSKKTREIVIKKEVELLKRADIVFTTSKLLYENKRKHNGNTHYLPNAADINYYRRLQSPKIRENLIMEKIKKPIIGYFGTIHNRTDIELLAYAAQKRPDWSFVLIGPLEKGYDQTGAYKEFEYLPNAHLLGWINNDELLGYLKAFDVCVIPYKVDSEFNQNVNPSKMHEYTAMGKPVVSTNLPEVQSYKGIIYIANNQDEFIDLIEKAMQEDSKEKIAERLRKAEENSWDKRAEEILSIIKDTMKRKFL